MTYCSPNLNELTNMARTLPQFTQAPDVTQERFSPILDIIFGFFSVLNHLLPFGHLDYENLDILL